MLIYSNKKKWWLSRIFPRLPTALSVNNFNWWSFFLCAQKSLTHSNFNRRVNGCQRVHSFIQSYNFNSIILIFFLLLLFSYVFAINSLPSGDGKQLPKIHKLSFTWICKNMVSFPWHLNCHSKRVHFQLNISIGVHCVVLMKFKHIYSQIKSYTDTK